MATTPTIKGIPLYSGPATDKDGFAPLYDPQAIRFARKLNLIIGVVLGLAFFVLIFLFFSSLALDSAADSESPMVRIMASFVLPLFLCMVGFLAVMILTPKIGFNLPKAYSATADALREWLPTAAGEYPEPKEDVVEGLKDSFSTVEDGLRFVFEVDGESFLLGAAKHIAQQSPEDVTLFSKDNRFSSLRMEATGRYELVLD